MVVSPTQAEILYDAALEDELRGVRPRKSRIPSVTDDWDDRDPIEGIDAGEAPRASAPKRHSR
jgi:hypothetical protein